MIESFEAPKMWVPAEGDIVQLKPGPQQTNELFAMRQAQRMIGEKELAEDTLYEVVKYEQDAERRAVTVRPVHVIHVAGERIVTPKEKNDAGKEFPLGYFELAEKHKEKRN